jgi:hypothetical protein
VWGRRRVGKTRLLLEWVRAHGGVYWVADQSASTLQRANLADTLASRFSGMGGVTYPDFGVLLSRLAREAQLARWRGPLVIDELPYLVAASPEFPAILQRFIDHQARETGLVVALAGSSQHMMHDLALTASAPLYGRAQELLRIGPLPAGYAMDAFKERDAARAASAYAVFGGIPRYWELAEGIADLREAVDVLALDPRGVLHDEPNRLLMEELPSALALRPILDAIGAGAHRVSEIGGRVGQPATSLVRPMARLQELGLVTREIPFGEAERTSKKALYKLADPFLRLWFTLIAPKRSLLAQIPKQARLQLLDGVFPRLASVAWEELCRRAVPRLAPRLGNVQWGATGRYWSGAEPEWDVVARSMDGKSVLLGEVKWVEETAPASAVTRAIKTVLSKAAPSIPATSGVEIHRAVFVSRLSPRQPRVVSGVHIVDARDVLGALR